MSLGGAYGEGVAIAGLGVPRIARKADGNYAVFNNFAAIQTFYRNIDKPERGYAAIVGTVDANGNVATVTAAYVWDYDNDEWDSVVTDLIGADGEAPIMQGVFDASKAGGYVEPQLVRYDNPISKKPGVYQCISGTATNALPTDGTKWALMWEEEGVPLPTHKNFKVELLFTPTPASPVTVLGTFTKVNFKWNIKELSASDEKINRVRITQPDNTVTTATAAQLAASEVEITKNWTRPANGHTLSFSVEFTTDKGNSVTQTASLRWQNRYYYGYSALGAAGTPLTSAEVKNAAKFTVGNSATYPNSLDVRRVATTLAYGYILLSRQDVLPDTWDMRGYPILHKQGTLAIDGVTYQVYRTVSQTHTNDLKLFAE